MGKPVRQPPPQEVFLSLLLAALLVAVLVHANTGNGSSVRKAFRNCAIAAC